jgi:hypothetical protein
MLQNVSSDSRNNFLIVIDYLRIFNINVIYERQADVRDMFFQNFRDDSNELRYRIRYSLQYNRLPEKAERYYESSYVFIFKV